MCRQWSNGYCSGASLREKEINYQHKLHVTAIDIDTLCVHMAYVQCTLLHIPALICHGDSLRGDVYSEWRTFAHVLGFWDAKLAQDDRKLPTPSPAQEPLKKPAAEPTAPLHPVGTQLSLF